MPSTVPVAEHETKDTHKFQEPSMFNVIIHNDDKTTFDFVIYLLQVVFYKDQESAIEITYNVHTVGQGVVGKYTKEIACEKVTEGTNLARANGFPLMLTMAPEDK